MTLAAGAGDYAGPLGMLVVLLMGTATVLLVKNMATRIKRLPDTFDKPGEADKADHIKADDIGPDDLAG